jgi:small subunit ribosomal protein S6
MPEAQLRGLDREYETIYVLSPNVDREAAEKISARVTDAVGKQGGKLTLLESWGRRKLAYPVQKHRRGIYVYLKYVGQGGVVHELERQLRMVDTVLKYQTVKIADGVFADKYVVEEERLLYTHIEPEEDEQDESKAAILGLENPRQERREPSEASSEEATEESASAAPEGEVQPTVKAAEESASAEKAEKAEGDANKEES